MPNTVDALNQLTSEYISERDLHKKTKDRRMSRIIVALADGRVNISGCAIPQVDYIIFELADCDVREHLNTALDVDAVLRLKVLHNMTVALRQLHGSEIAHQDLKPSNVFMVSDGTHSVQVSKLGDLGRASDAKRPALHDILPITGDRNYAPPEQLYREIHADFGQRRLACDLYQLGSLTTFMFAGATMNSLISEKLHSSHKWMNWKGPYREALPYVIDAFERALADLHDRLPPSISDELIFIVRCLCEPDPSRRGHPGNSSNPAARYSLQRIVTQFDRLAKRVAVDIYAGVA